MLQHKSIFNVPFLMFTPNSSKYFSVFQQQLSISQFFTFFSPYLGNISYNWHAALHTVPVVSSLSIDGAEQVLMSSIRGLPSDYAVLYYMLNAQLFLSLNPYFRDTTVCRKLDSLGVTQVTHQGCKHLDLTLFSWTGCDYMPQTHTKTLVSSMQIFFFLSRKFPLLSSSYKKQSSTTTSMIT